MCASVFKAISNQFGMTDEQAMWRVQGEDDAAAFARLVERWEKPIQNLGARMTGEAHRGEDLAQETFARVYARRKEYQPNGKFSTWLWRIALNLCYDELRRMRRRSESSLDDEAGEGRAMLETIASGEAAAAERLEAQERIDEVKMALQQLGEPYRAVLVLRHYENLKFREIAEVLEIPEGTVKSRMAEALSQLGEILKRQVVFAPCIVPPGKNEPADLWRVKSGLLERI